MYNSHDVFCFQKKNNVRRQIFFYILYFVFFFWLHVYWYVRTDKLYYILKKIYLSLSLSYLYLKKICIYDI